MRVCHAVDAGKAGRTARKEPEWWRGLVIGAAWVRGRGNACEGDFVFAVADRPRATFGSALGPPTRERKRGETLKGACHVRGKLAQPRAKLSDLRNQVDASLFLSFIFDSVSGIRSPCQMVVVMSK